MTSTGAFIERVPPLTLKQLSRDYKLYLNTCNNRCKQYIREYYGDKEFLSFLIFDQAAVFSGLKCSSPSLKIHVYPYVVNRTTGQEVQYLEDKAGYFLLRKDDLMPWSQISGYYAKLNQKYMGGSKKMLLFHIHFIEDNTHRFLVKTVFCSRKVTPTDGSTDSGTDKNAPVKFSDYYQAVGGAASLFQLDPHPPTTNSGAQPLTMRNLAQEDVSKRTNQASKRFRTEPPSAGGSGSGSPTTNYSPASSSSYVSVGVNPMMDNSYAVVSLKPTFNNQSYTLHLMHTIFDYTLVEDCLVLLPNSDVTIKQEQVQWMFNFAKPPLPVVYCENNNMWLQGVESGAKYSFVIYNLNTGKLVLYVLQTANNGYLFLPCPRGSSIKGILFEEQGMAFKSFFTSLRVGGHNPMQSLRQSASYNAQLNVSSPGTSSTASSSSQNGTTVSSGTIQAYRTTKKLAEEQILQFISACFYQQNLETVKQVLTQNPGILQEVHSSGLTCEELISYMIDEQTSFEWDDDKVLVTQEYIRELQLCIQASKDAAATTTVHEVLEKGSGSDSEVPLELDESDDNHIYQFLIDCFIYQNLNSVKLQLLENPSILQQRHSHGSTCLELVGVFIEDYCSTEWDEEKFLVSNEYIQQLMTCLSLASMPGTEGMQFCTTSRTVSAKYMETEVTVTMPKISSLSYLLEVISNKLKRQVTSDTHEVKIENSNGDLLEVHSDEDYLHVASLDISLLKVFINDKEEPTERVVPAPHGSRSTVSEQSELEAAPGSAALPQKKLSVSVISTVTENVDIYEYKESFKDALPGPIAKEGLPIAVTIKCTPTAHKLISSRFASEDALVYSLTKCIQYMQSIGEKGLLDRMFGEIALGDRELTEEGKTVLSDEFCYEILDNSEIEVLFTDAKGNPISDRKADEDNLFHLKTFQICKVEYLVNKIPQPNPAESSEQKITAENKKYLSSRWLDTRVSKIRRFINFLCHSAGLTFSYVSRAQVNNGLGRIAHELIGFDRTVNTVSEKFQTFAPDPNQIPRGIILYGHPGNGKTTLAYKLVKHWNLFPVARQTGSDFQQHELLLKVAQRAATIPWELTVLLIDEIEQLSKTTSEQILSLLGGIRNQQNLVLVGTTSDITKMDAAFLRRMDCKMFIGSPSFNDRLQWLTNPPHPLAAPKFNFDVTQVAEMTCNFSHDAMKRLVGLLTLKSAKAPFSLEYVRKPVKRVGAGVYFGKYMLPQMLQDSESLPSNFGDYLCKLASNPTIDHNSCSKRMLVDLENPEKLLQIEFLDQHDPSSNTAIQEMVYQEICSSPDLIALQGTTLEEKINGYDRTFLSHVLEVPAGSHMNNGDFIRLIKLVFPSIAPLVDTNIQLRALDIINPLRKVCLQQNPGLMTPTLMELRLKSCGLIADLGNYKTIILQNCINAYEQYNDRGSLPELLQDVSRAISVLLRGHCEIIKQLMERQIAKSIIKSKVKVLDNHKPLPRKSILRDLVKMGSQLDTIQYVDAMHMTRKKLTEESQIIGEIARIVDECKMYPQSMVILDLASLADVWEETARHNSILFDSVTRTPTSSNYKVLRPNVLAECFRVMEYSVDEDPSKTSMWKVAISSNSYITQLFNEKVAWPKIKTIKLEITPQELVVVQDSLVPIVSKPELLSYTKTETEQDEGSCKETPNYIGKVEYTSQEKTPTSTTPMTPTTEIQDVSIKIQRSVHLH